jgi:transposase
MKKPSEQFAAHIGLDWADTKHDICLQYQGSNDLEYDVIQHSPEAIEAWAIALQQRFNNQRVAICLELKAGPVVYALLKYAFITLFPIPPKALAKYREAFSQNGAKDDPTDAYLQLDYLLNHRNALRALEPDSVDTRILQRLVEDRRTLIGEKVRLTNRITASIKSYFPHLLQWFEDIDTLIFCNFVQRWSTLQKAQSARKDTLEKFFKAHNCVRPAVINRRIKAIKEAMALTDDEGVLIPHERLALSLLSQLKIVIQVIHDYDLEIAKRFRKHDDYDIFKSLPGAGPVFGPRLLTAFGSDRKRFEAADEVTRIYGVAPVVERSGKRCWTHWRYSCPKFMRQTFVEWANQTIRYSYWAKEFYDEKRAQGKSHQATLRALAFKWIRIIFRCWKNKTPYDESMYLFALKKRKQVTA